MITTTPTITTSATQHTIDELKFAHRWILKRNDTFEDQWLTEMFEHGYRFAAHFASMFPGREEQVSALLLNEPATDGNEHNWFWMWWKFKYMQDDWNYINGKVYNQPITYSHYKSYMLHDEQLENDLLDLLNQKEAE